MPRSKKVHHHHKDKDNLISQEDFNQMSSDIEINNIPLPHNLNYDDENRDSYNETLMGMEYALEELEEEEDDEDELLLLSEEDEEAIEDDYSLEEDDDLHKPEINQAAYTTSL